MKKIFYIHSNILAICCYQTVKEALNQNEKVIIITNRQCQWNFFKDQVVVYDFAELFYGYTKNRVALHNIKAIKDYLKYRRYLCHLNKIVNHIIADEYFVFYLPSMADSMTASFAYNKFCKGYYYVDEGSLAYLPQDMININITNNVKNKIKRILKIDDHCHYEINQTFKGTVSITEEAFQWNRDKEKNVNPISECVEELKVGLPSYDDVIVTGFLSEDIDFIIKGIDFTINNILRKSRNSRIGIKLHPYAITYNRKNATLVLVYIKEKYNNRISIIPKDLSIEALSLVYHPNLYSLFTLSSVVLYGLLFKSSDGYLVRNVKGINSIVQIATVEDFYKTISVVNLGK